MPNANEVLGRRALNRALLQRQFLLERVDASVADTLEQFVGLQAQAPLLPYYGLWSRLRGFDPHELGRLLVDRKAVRLSLMRWTVHLVTTRDALALRPLLQPVIERGFGARRRVAGRPLTRLVAATHELLGDGPLSERELGRELVARGIGDDPETIGRAARVYVPAVQVPPRGVWGERGQARYATLEAWAGKPLEAEPSVEALVLRYLGAFGPATIADMQRWSGLTKVKAAFEELRPRLVTFRDEDGKELFDLPDAPRPGPDVAAPVRFLAEYDNVLLGHADRRRIIPEDFPWRTVLDEGHFVSNVLVDGMLKAVWRLVRDGKRATLLVRPGARLSRAERDEVGAEAERMLDFAAADAETRGVRFERRL